jgi:hypothetical protein
MKSNRLVLTRIIILILLVVAAGVSAEASTIAIPMNDGDTINVTRSTADANQVLGFNAFSQSQGGFQIVVSVNIDKSRSSDQWYHYTYTVTGTDGNNLTKNLSHILIEVTNPSVLGDFKNVTPSIADGPQTFKPSDGGGTVYYGMPGDIYAVKWNAPTGSKSFTFDFYTFKNPVWGDFYARCGGQPESPGGPTIFNYAYNAKFGSDPTFADAPYNGWIPTPNGGEVPLPASIMLLGSGLLGLGAAGWRRRNRS